MEGDQIMINNKIITISEFRLIDTPKPIIVYNKLVYYILIALFFITIFSITFLIFRTGETKQPVPIDIKKIVGTYLCNFESPEKKELKVEIIVDSVSNRTKDTANYRLFGRFTNYEYRIPSPSFEFIFTTGNLEFNNEILGRGKVVKNSMGDIEFVSNPENEKKWRMRKID